MPYPSDARALPGDAFASSRSFITTLAAFLFHVVALRTLRVQMPRFGKFPSGAKEVPAEARFSREQKSPSSLGKSEVQKLKVGRFAQVKTSSLKPKAAGPAAGPRATA